MRTRHTELQILAWNDVVTARQRSKCPLAHFLVILSLLWFIFYTNPSCVRVFVFHLHYHAMHRQLLSGHGAKFKWTKAKHHWFGNAFCAFEQKKQFQRRSFACGGVQTKIPSPGFNYENKLHLVPLSKESVSTSCVSSALRCLLHFFVSTLNSFVS